MNRVLSLSGLRGESEEFMQRMSAYNRGVNAQDSHERAMNINREWLATKEKLNLNYTQLAKYYGVSRTNAVNRCMKALEERNER